MKYVEALKSLPQSLHATDSELARFSKHLEQAESWRAERLERVRARAFSDDMDIVHWIVAARDSGDLDEALWRGFLGAHFGEPLQEPSAARSAGLILCAFGASPTWTWSRLFAEAFPLLKWLLEHEAELEGLHFGNHRKYEAKKPKLFYDVIYAFILWVRMNGGSPQSAFRTNGGTAEERFDILFRQLDIWHFDRLGKYDLLCLYGDLDLLPIRAGSCYLIGASGPLDAAKQLWGSRPAKELNRLADATASKLEIPYPVFEDALCNWQK